jgi:hypothetical protein
LVGTFFAASYSKTALNEYSSKTWIEKTQTVGYIGASTVFFTDLEGKKLSLILDKSWKFQP